MPQDLDPQLNRNYNFENFIEGMSNKLPRSVGQAIAEHPKQTTFNPSSSTAPPAWARPTW